MLGWAAFFFIIALISGVMGFTGISVATAQIAQVLFFKGSEPPEVSYKDKKGKYQGQQGVTLPKL